ncbi:MAG: lytic transglycosylase domain-containing protein [Longimicrobiales bacterium]
MRKIPLKKGLEKMLARPAVKQVLLGLALLVPAVGFMARVPEMNDGLTSVQVIEERSRADLVSDAWRARMDDMSNQQVVNTLAAEFNVPVTLAHDIHEAALVEEIDPRMAFGLVRAESRFRETIVSPVGAVGLTQVMPATARWLVPGTSTADLKNPETNLKVGFKYLRSLLNRYDGDRNLALTAYNRGPGTVSKLLKTGRDPDNGYAEMVMTGRSSKHVSLMNAKFGTKSSKAKPPVRKRLRKSHS